MEFHFGNRARPDPQDLALPVWNQVHGIQIGFVESAGQDLGDVDGMWTTVSGLTVAVRTADCVPILLRRRDGAAVAALHAGWRGSIADIVGQFVATVERAGDAPAEWEAMIGPSARGCCYEVDEDLARRFQERVPASVKGRNLDLAAFNASRLRELGVQKIDVHPACTICAIDENGPIFHSFRREKGRARQVSWLTLS